MAEIRLKENESLESAVCSERGIKENGSRFPAFCNRNRREQTVRKRR